LLQDCRLEDRVDFGYRKVISLKFIVAWQSMIVREILEFKDDMSADIDLEKELSQVIRATLKCSTELWHVAHKP
jgi:hypothetical protein